MNLLVLGLIKEDVSGNVFYTDVKFIAREYFCYIAIENNFVHFHSLVQSNLLVMNNVGNNIQFIYFGTSKIFLL